MTSHQDATATARAKEVLAQCLEHGNGHEANRGMEAGTQSHGMTGSQAHGASHLPGSGASGTQTLASVVEGALVRSQDASF